MKYKVIYHRREKYAIQTMCRFFGVSRSGYYDYVKRMDVPDRDEALADQITQCQKQNRSIYGYRRVHIWLERRGIHHNPKTILRVMNKYGLLSEIRRRKKYRIMGQQLHRYENILNRNFTADRPNQKWVTDISYIHTAQGVLYLSVIRDLFDNSIIAHRTGTEQTVNLVLNTLKDAKAKEMAAAELLLHSDQGLQYTSHGYFTMAENFFSILKSECIYRQKLDTYDQARLLIDQYIHFYNYDRIQLKTRLTPFEKRSQAA